MELHFKGEGLWKIVVNSAVLLNIFEKDDAKAQYILDICIRDGDREQVQECKTVRDI
jgi:gag-polypeptide of LTR copia-type